jgi:hypothetical protein
MHDFRKFIQAGIGVLLIVVGLYAIDYYQKEILVLDVIAGAFGMAALIAKIWN